LRRAAAAAMCGQDMDVPEKMFHSTFLSSAINLVGESSPVHAANMFNPGPVISGCMNPSSNDQYFHVKQFKPVIN